MPLAQSDPSTWERHYGDTTAEEREQIARGRCVLPCNTAVCKLYGSEEMIRSDGRIRRPDGLRAWCAGCATDRSIPCARRRCSFDCHFCHVEYRSRGTKDPTAVIEGIPAVCGQKHPFVNTVIEDELGGLDYDNADIAWIPPVKRPYDRFIAGVERNKTFVRLATERTGHRSWMAAAKGMFPKGPRDVREAFGIEDDHFFALNFRIKDKILEDIWEGDRLRFFDWIARQRFDMVMMVNFSPWGNMPRALAFQSLKRMFICYREMTERGVSVAFEYDSLLPWYLIKYQQDFLVRNGIGALHESFQTMRSSHQIGRVVKNARSLPEGMMFVLSGISSVERALPAIAAYRRNGDIYLSNLDAYMRSKYWELPGGQRMSRQKASSAEIFCMGLERWRAWSKKLLPALAGDQSI